jgi:hypothetical protein
MVSATPAALFSPIIGRTTSPVNRPLLSTIGSVHTTLLAKISVASGSRQT